MTLQLNAPSYEDGRHVNLSQRFQIVPIVPNTRAISHFSAAERKRPCYDTYRIMIYGTPHQIQGTRRLTYMKTQGLHQTSPFTDFSPIDLVQSICPSSCRI